ncbi:MAG: leucine--tRNA ligase, partial [Halobacteriaceae archaeon]
TTRDDVRAIAEAIQGAPERVAIATAPEWKYRAYRIARRAEGDVYDAVLEDGSVASHGEEAREYAGSLATRARTLTETLSPEREYEALRRATWLLEKEFDAEVVVQRAENAPADLRERAEPGKPGIDLT